MANEPKMTDETNGVTRHSVDRFVGTNEISVCQECGMPVRNNAYHPYAACLMFKACKNSTVVTENLIAVVDHGKKLSANPELTRER